MLATIVGNILSLIVLLTLWMVGSGPRARRWSYFIGAANQIAWCWYAIFLVPQWQILTLEVGLFVIYVRNIVRGE